MKRTVSIILTLLLAFSIVSPCLAIVDDAAVEVTEIEAGRAVDVGVVLSINSSGVATVVLRCYDGSDVDSISAKVHMERLTKGFWTKVYLKTANSQVIITQDGSTLNRTLKIPMPNAVPGTFRVVADITYYGDTTRTRTMIAQAVYSN